MIVYFTLTAAVLALLLLVKKNTSAGDIDVFALTAIFLGLFAVSALRLNVGNDYGPYVERMHLVNSRTAEWTPKVTTEAGFNTLAIVIYSLCGFENYVLVFAVLAFFTVLFFYERNMETE